MAGLTLLPPLRGEEGEAVQVSALAKHAVVTVVVIVVRQQHRDMQVTAVTAGVSSTEECVSLGCNR